MTTTILMAAAVIFLDLAPWFFMLRIKRKKRRESKSIFITKKLIHHCGGKTIIFVKKSIYVQNEHKTDLEDKLKRNFTNFLLGRDIPFKTNYYVSKTFYIPELNKRGNHHISLILN